MKRSLSQAVTCYLTTRRSLGFALVKEGFLLQSLVRFAKQRGHTGPLTAQLAIAWAQQPCPAAQVYRATRLDIVRRLAQFWVVYDPRTEIPPQGLFGSAYRRRAVHVYKRREIATLLQAAAKLRPRWRGWTFPTLLGLLDCTGLRIGEALALTDQDVDWSAGVLTIRHAKYGHARLVPVQPGTVAALQQYRTRRQQVLGPCVAPTFFVTPDGQPLPYGEVSRGFRKLCRRLGWTQEPLPRLHDLRHTFAVRTLLGWYRGGAAIDAKLWTLSTYLGHRHLADTYWYLSAVPELLQRYQQRFATAQAWASGGRGHD